MGAVFEVDGRVAEFSQRARTVRPEISLLLSRGIPRRPCILPVHSERTLRVQRVRLLGDGSCVNKGELSAPSR